MPDREPLGAKIRRLRSERGLSQDRLSLEANVDQSGLSKLERGDRSMSDGQLERIAKILGLDFDDLIAETDYPRKR